MATQPRSLKVIDRGIGLTGIVSAVRALTRREVLVGVPSDRSERAPDTNSAEPEPITNAMIGYINEYGSPKSNIPARPHLAPGVFRAKEPITDAFRRASLASMEGDEDGVERNLARAGFVAVSSVRRYIEDVIPPPLAPQTLVARAQRRQRGRLLNSTAMANYQSGARGKLSHYLGGTQLTGIDLVNDKNVTLASVGTTPLLDTGEYRKSITWVIRGGSGGQVEGP